MNFLHTPRCGRRVGSADARHFGTRAQDNILINADGSLKICDFGLSRGFASPCEETGVGMMSECVSTFPALVVSSFLSNKTEFGSNLCLCRRRDEVVPSSRDHAEPRKLRESCLQLSPVLFIDAYVPPSFCACRRPRWTYGVQGASLLNCWGASRSSRSVPLARDCCLHA